MEHIDFKSLDIGVEFGGYKLILAPTNYHNQQKVREAYTEILKYADLFDEQKKKEEEINSDDRLKDSTKEKRIKELRKQYEKRRDEEFSELPEKRKKVVDIVVKEWVDGQPDDEFYSNEYFDDYALGRLISFFFNPSISRMNRLNGSGN